MASGAHRLFLESLALSSLYPSLTFTSLDATNAFGNMSRIHSLRAIRDKLPSLAPIMSSIWATGPTNVWVETSPGIWQTHLVYDGLFQGECLASIIYCLGAATALDTFWSRVHTTPNIADYFVNLTNPTDTIITVLAYIDDMLLIAPDHLLRQLHDIL